MRFFQIIWDHGDLPKGNVRHIAEHGLAIEDVEYVLEHAIDETITKRSKRPCCKGFTPSGELIIVIYEKIDEDTIYPITAYELTESD